MMSHIKINHRSTLTELKIFMGQMGLVPRKYIREKVAVIPYNIRNYKCGNGSSPVAPV